MAHKDICQKYGGRKLHATINRAIRAEIIGGNACLDALGNLDILIKKILKYGRPGLQKARQAANLVTDIRNEMEDEIRRKYDALDNLDD